MQTMPKELRVLVVMEDSLLEHGIVQRLLEEPDIEVQTVGKDCPDLRGILGTFKPHVSIVDEKEAPVLEQILATHPKGAVVTISLDREGATVYQALHLSITTVRELVDYLKRVRGRPSGPRSRGQRDADPAEGAAGS